MEFSKTVSQWLERSAESRRSSTVDGSYVHVSTDIGLTRGENQDRAVVLSGTDKNEGDFRVFVVSDGMGGMRDGGRCATIAVTSFLFHLVHDAGNALASRLAGAIEYSNREVNRLYAGRGGATLSALLMTENWAAIANVGDSRVYSYSPGGQVVRRTVDDSLAEIVGGTGRELIQFIGMGDGIKPLSTLVDDLSSSFLLTTDGVHGLEERTFSSVVRNSTTCVQVGERLIALSRWCGGIDNATCIVVDKAFALGGWNAKVDEMVRLWDASGEMCLQLDSLPDLDKLGLVEAEGTSSDQDSSSGAQSNAARVDLKSKVRSRTRKRKSASKKGAERTEMQLSIEIGAHDSNAAGGGNDRE